MIPSVRDLFPGARHRTYLDVAAKGLVPTTVRDHVHAYLDDQVSGTTDKARLRERVEEARSRLARIVGAGVEEVAITKNVSEGINLVAASLPWESGDNVVVCPGVEHPNNVYPWYNLHSRLGVEIRRIPSLDGAVPVPAMTAAMDGRTRVVTFPSVSSVPGFLTDTSPLVEAARSTGALTVVDGAQSVGAIDTDVRAMGFDVMATTAQKCLLSFFGTGFLYVRREVAEKLSPVHLARFGVELDAPESEHGEGPLRYRPGALRFELGNHNYLGASAACVSLELIEDVGVAVVEKHVRHLATRLAEGLLELGLPVAGGAPGPHLAHIVTVGGVPGAETAGTSLADSALSSLHRTLKRRDIVHSRRRGTLRFSVGLYNDASDVDEVLAAVRAWRSEAS